MVSTGRALLAALLTLSFSAFLAPTEARGANDPECEELEARWTQLSESPLEACDEDPECKARRLRGLKGLRDTLAEHPPECQATTLPKVWALEFQLTSPTKHDGVRARVREDLERLRGLGLEHLDTWWRALQEGYESVGDAEAVTRLEEEAWEVAPCLSWTVRQQSSRWRETLFTSKEEETAILDLWEASHRWLERCPDEPRYTFLRAMAATKHPGLDDEELLVELDRHRRVWEASQDEPGAPSAPWGFLARTLLERNLELERAREFAEKAVAAARSAETSDSLEQVPAQVAERLRLRRRQQHFLHEIQGLSLLARAQFALGREDALQATFEEARATGARLEKLETEHADSLSMTFSSVLAPQAAIMTGQQAERMGHTADAFAFFRRALELRPGNPNLTEKVEELWQELGGSSMGWQALAASRTQQPAGTEGSKSTEGKADPAVSWDWEARNEPLPSLRLSDLQGRIWNKEDLAGQAVLINAWATWCGPCRVELPYVQELHERLANDETKTVVTLNSDQNVGLIQPFLEENGFDFPVLLALPFLQNELGGPPLPQSWIVDPSGTVRYQQAGFDSSRADTWIEDMLARLEEVSSLRQAE